MATKVAVRRQMVKMRNVSDKIVNKIKTHFMFDNFFFENRAVYKMIWKNTVELVRQKMTI